MSPRPLVEEAIDAGARFVHELNKSLPVKLAFWLRRPESMNWNLYVVSEQGTRESERDYYGEVQRVQTALANPNLPLAGVRLVGVDEPLARAVLEIPYIGNAPFRIRERHFPDAYIEEAYVYPAPAPAAVA